MRLYVIFSVAITLLLSTLVSAASIPYEDMSDFEIAKMFVGNALPSTGRIYDSSGSGDTGSNGGGLEEDKIIYPQNNDTWYVGELVNVTYESTKDSTETVSIFFFDKTPLLAGGPLTEKVFPFVVPASAVSPPGGTSLLLAVRRQNLYLQTVDSIIISVLPGNPNEN